MQGMTSSLQFSHDFLSVSILIILVLSISRCQILMLKYTHILSYSSNSKYFIKTWMVHLQVEYRETKKQNYSFSSVPII